MVNVVVVVGNGVFDWIELFFEVIVDVVMIGNEILIFYRIVWVLCFGCL